MSLIRPFAIACGATVIALSALAQDDHQAHHPASGPSAAMPSPATGKPVNMPDMAMMDKHMKAMQAMHQKMASARTPAEREALMAEHMKLMQEGMSMMQMMMDRMSVSPAAPGK